MTRYQPDNMILIHLETGKEWPVFGVDFIDYNENKFKIKGRKEDREFSFDPHSLF